MIQQTGTETSGVIANNRIIIIKVSSFAISFGFMQLVNTLPVDEVFTNFFVNSIHELALINVATFLSRRCILKDKLQQDI